MEKIVELKNVSKTYKIGESEFKALKNIDLEQRRICSNPWTIRSRKINTTKPNRRNGHTNRRKYKN